MKTETAALLGQQIGHIQIVDVLGEGGMGAVYVGFDDTLQREVALKAIRSEFRLDEVAKARFLREARILSQMNHPNVCVVHDFIEGEDVDFLVLERIDGQNLRVALKEGLDHAHKLEIARQLLDVLVSVHGQGVIHRDLKPENVMITPDGAVKVLDFGLARSVEEECWLPSEFPTIGVGEQLGDSDADRGSGLPQSSRSGYVQTALGSVVGTVGYMSPEQARGESAAAASDMYSLGLVLQEMFSASPPFEEGQRPIELLVKAAAGETLPVTGLDRGLTALIEGLKSFEPEARPSAPEAAGQLQRIIERPRRRRLVAVVLGVVVMVGVSTWSTWFLTRPTPWIEIVRSERVAILPFENATGSPGDDWVELGLQQMVVESLGERLGGIVARAADAAKVAADMGVRGRAELTDEEVMAVARALEVEAVVTAQVRREGARFELTYRAARGTGRVRRGSVSAFSLTELANALLGELAIHIDPAAAAVTLGDTYSRDGLANTTYAMGIAAFDSDGALRAKSYFEVSLDRDPDLALAKLQLSLCEERLGNRERATELAENVLEQARATGAKVLEAASLRRLGPLAVLRGDYEQARSILGRALELTKDNENNGSRADVLNDLGRLELRQVRLDEAEALFAEALELAVEAGRPGLETTILVNQGMVVWRRGAIEDAERLFTRALERTEVLADRDLKLVCLTNLGALAIESLRLAEADKLFGRGLELATEVGNQEAELVALANLGVVAFMREEIETAEERLRDVLAIRRKMGDRAGQAKALNNLGSVAFKQDHLDQAAVLWEEALAIRTELGDEYGQALVFVGLAELVEKQGRIDQARDLLTRAKGIFDRLGDLRAAAAATKDLGQLEVGDGRLREARQRLEEARAYPVEQPDLQLLEARLAFASGKPDQALELQLAAKDAIGEAWNEVEESALEEYQEAARVRGRR